MLSIKENVELFISQFFKLQNQPQVQKDILTSLLTDLANKAAYGEWAQEVDAVNNIINVSVDAAARLNQVLNRLPMPESQRNRIEAKLYPFRPKIREGLELDAAMDRIKNSGGDRPDATTQQGNFDNEQKEKIERAGI